MRSGLVLLLFLLVAATQIGQSLWIFGKALVAQYLLRRAWDCTITGEQRVKPWPWADTWPVARLVVPRLGVDLIVLSNASARTLAFGPARYAESSRAGTHGRTILTGHRDTHFRFLQHLRHGDLLHLQNARGTRQFYRVRRLSVVDSRRGVPVTDYPEETLALVTCYPFDAVIPGGPMRYVVEAEAIPGHPAPSGAKLHARPQVLWGSCR